MRPAATLESELLRGAMNLYIESSALVSWILGESAGTIVQPIVARASAVATSQLTLVECDRAFIRGHTTGTLTTSELAGARKRLVDFSAHWTIVALSPEVMTRARQPFPLEPIRTLDALHVATALEIRSSLPDPSVVTLDDRIAKVARAAGFNVLPA